MEEALALSLSLLLNTARMASEMGDLVVVIGLGVVVV